MPAIIDSHVHVTMPVEFYKINHYLLEKTFHTSKYLKYTLEC